MSNRWIRLVALSFGFALLLMAAATGRASDVAYSGDNMTITAKNRDSDGTLNGQITLDGKSYPFSARGLGDQLDGSFVADGHTFPCTLRYGPGEQLTFETGGATYQLRRQAPAARNPLAGPRPQAPAAPGAVTAAGGVGVAFERENKDGKWRIAALKPGGPAEQAGILVGDIVTEVDEKSTEGQTIEQLGAMLRGDVGSVVRISTLTLYPGGGQTVATREVERAPLIETAPGTAAGSKSAGLRPYHHRSGLWSITMPGTEQGWRLEESQDGSTTKWTHASGAMVFVTLVPQCPFPSGEAFFQQAVLPGLQQSGAQIAHASAYNGAGASGYTGQFMRQREGAKELGQSTTYVVNGTGIILQMLLPQSAPAELNDLYGEIAVAFRVNAK